MRVRIPGLYIVLGLVLAGLIHIVAVLTLPMLAPRNAQARLAALGPANTMIELPPASPGHQAMPMMAPDVRYAFCRFDLTNGPIRLRAAIADELWLIALYTPEGENFYTVAGADMKRAQLDLILAAADQTVEEAGVDAPESSDEVLVVNAPVTEGIALIRAPLAGPSRARKGRERAEGHLLRPLHQVGLAPVRRYFFLRCNRRRGDEPVCSGISIDARRSILTPGKMMISPSDPSTGAAIRSAASSLRRYSRIVPIVPLHGRLRVGKIAGTTSAGHH